MKNDNILTALDNIKNQINTESTETSQNLIDALNNIAEAIKAGGGGSGGESGSGSVFWIEFEPDSTDPTKIIVTNRTTQEIREALKNNENIMARPAVSKLTPEGQARRAPIFYLIDFAYGNKTTPEYYEQSYGYHDFLNFQKISYTTAMNSNEDEAFYLSYDEIVIDTVTLTGQFNRASMYITETSQNDFYTSNNFNNFYGHLYL